MGELPFISVIVPHLNQLEPLRRCLDSLARQTYPRHSFEVVVVDNGSDESPAPVVETLDRARLVLESTPGPGPARNRGVTESRGEILAFVDADCLADPGWLEAIAASLCGPGAARIIGGEVRVALADPGRPTMLEAYESVFAYRQKEYIEEKGFSGTGNLAVWRADFDKVGPFDGIEIAEDRAWGQRAVALGYRVGYVPDMLILHPARTSMRELREKWNRHISHDYREWRQKGLGPAAWAVRAVAVAGSPLRDVVRTFRSPRISGAGAKLRAATVLIHIRLFRAWRMIGQLWRKKDRGSTLTWNRSRT